MKTAFLLVTAVQLCTYSFSQNVGIGTTNPLYKLDVRNGSINVDSVYRIGTISVLAVPGLSNLFVGKDAGRVNYGFSNTISGHEAGFNDTTGYQNSFFGHAAGYSNAQGVNNSFFGQIAGAQNTEGNNNSFFGQACGPSNTTGYQNSFFGQGAGASNNEGNDNCFFGLQAGFYNSSGSENSFFGREAGYTNSTGSNNTIFGFFANVFSSALTNATAIGDHAVVDASNKVRIGNTSVTSIGGQVGWSTFSDGRFKLQVQEDVQGLAFIKKLRTVSYQVDLTVLSNYYSAGKSELTKSSFLPQNTNSLSPEFVRQSGFIAQEVEQAANELGFSFSGIDKPQNEKALYGLRYGDFVVPLVKAIQEQQAIIDEQNKKIEMLMNELTMIKEKLK